MPGVHFALALTVKIQCKSDLRFFRIACNGSCSHERTTFFSESMICPIRSLSIFMLT